MMNQEFSQLLVIGAKTGKRPIIAAHTTVGAILAAIIGDFDDGADEHFLAEFAPCRCRSAFVQSRLHCAVCYDVRLCRKVAGIGHSEV
jgi:hypothetical protein